MKHMSMLVVSLLLCLTIGCATHQKTITAGQFILVDDNGEKRASLAMTNDGPQFALFGPDENLLVRLEALDDGSHLVLHSRMNAVTPLAPVFVGVGNRGSEETGFIQLVAYDRDAVINSMFAKDNFYFILDPQESTKGIRFDDEGRKGKISFDLTSSSLQLQLRNDKDEVIWRSDTSKTQ